MGLKSSNVLSSEGVGVIIRPGLGGPSSSKLKSSI